MKKWTAGGKEEVPWGGWGLTLETASVPEDCWDLRGHSKDTWRRVASGFVAVRRSSTFEWSSGPTFSSYVPPSLV